MSLYNPVLGCRNHRVPARFGLYGDRRADSILGRLRARREARRASRSITYNRRRNRLRPVERDLEKEVEKLEEKKRKEIELFEAAMKEEEEEKARNDAEKLEKLKDGVLLVQSINEHIEENAEEHHTDLFECTEREENPQLVVRRGQEFKMTLTFQRPYNKAEDDLYFNFRIGETPKINKKTKAVVRLREDEDRIYVEERKKGVWTARIVEESGNSVTIQVYSPPDAVIGEWEYSVVTVKGDDHLEYEGDQDLVLIFNPWCKDDQTYLEETELLNEYILNPTGTVYFGSAHRVYSKPWIYGQFQNGILEICVMLLRKANAGNVTAKMSDPVYVSRALSRVLNSCDEDQGVLTGRWDGDYDDGIRPLSWSGSANILKQYHETQESVKYGQCWVFSHLLTTVARALGLPCRSVTNFSSAHDTDNTMTIDKYVTEDGDEVPWMNSDSVWNFHVWNEVWILRPDLDKAFGVQGKYDGWQAVDATPQEASEGQFQCGPAPLNAVKLGDVHVGHDTGFVFAEVNGEKCTWTNTNPPKLISRDKHSVGKKLSTKYPDGKGFVKMPFFGDDAPEARLDVTDLYKAEEGSVAERTAVEKATRHGTKGDLLFQNKTGIEISMVEQGEPEIGNEFFVKVKVKNTSSELRRVITNITIRPIAYWGGIIKNHIIDKQLHRLKSIEPDQEMVYEVHIEPEEYVNKCDDAMSMRVLSLVKVIGFDDPLFFSDDFSLKPPEVIMEGPADKVALGDKCDVKITFKNPLANKNLTECVLRVDGSVYLDNPDFELKHAIYTKQIGTLKGGESKTITLITKPSPTPKKTKRREVTVSLASKELPDLEGNFEIELK